MIWNNESLQWFMLFKLKGCVVSSLAFNSSVALARKFVGNPLPYFLEGKSAAYSTSTLLRSTRGQIRRRTLHWGSSINDQYSYSFILWGSSDSMWVFFLYFLSKSSASFLNSSWVYISMFWSKPYWWAQIKVVFTTPLAKSLNFYILVVSFFPLLVKLNSCFQFFGGTILTAPIFPKSICFNFRIRSRGCFSSLTVDSYVGRSLISE